MLISISPTKQQLCHLLLQPTLHVAAAATVARRLHFLIAPQKMPKQQQQQQLCYALSNSVSQPGGRGQAFVQRAPNTTQLTFAAQLN